MRLDPQASQTDDGRRDMATKTAETVHRLPGEDQPLDMRYGGEPITAEEALGVARRLARVQAAQGRKLAAMGEVTELPEADARMVQSAHRFPPRLLFFARAKAEMEGVNLTDILTQALRAYVQAPPGAQVEYKLQYKVATRTKSARKGKDAPDDEAGDTPAGQDATAEPKGSPIFQEPTPQGANA